MDQVDADTAPQDALDRAAHALYAVPPVEFVPTRKAWVTHLRSVGLREVATEVAALRKPSVSAAAINALVRAEDPAVSLLVNVGARLRRAQAALDAAGMAALRAERDQVLADWIRAARAHAPGQSLTGAVEAEVRDTAVAALADEAATEVVTSGTLTRALNYSGFGEVDVADAVARTSTGVVLTRIEGGRTDDVEADEAEPADDDSAQEEPAHDEPAGDTEPAGPDITALEMDLDEAEKAVAATRAARKDAADADEAAQRAATIAAEQVAQAERLLAGARQHLEKATAASESTAAALAAAESELTTARQSRDAARVALEEAEDG